MAGKRWKKHIPTDAGSFRRPRGSSKPGSSILIVTEVEVTEPVYFDRSSASWHCKRWKSRSCLLAREIRDDLRKLP